MCISRNMDQIYQCINTILSKSIHFFLKILRKFEILTHIKAISLLKSAGKIHVLVTILHTEIFNKIHHGNFSV